MTEPDTLLCYLEYAALGGKDIPTIVQLENLDRRIRESTVAFCAAYDAQMTACNILGQNHGMGT